MNTINKLLILIIILFLINHLTNGKITYLLKKYLNIGKTHIEKFMGITYTNSRGIYPNHPVVPYNKQRDFPYINHNDPDVLDNESYELYHFIDSLVNVNTNMHEMTVSNSTKHKANSNLTNFILSNLTKSLNCKGYTFSNIKLIDDIYYHDNPRGKEIELFNITADLNYHNKSLGFVTLSFETFIRNNRLEILNVKLIDRKNKPKNKIYKKALHKNQEMIYKMNDSFNNHFVNRDDYDELFIKPTQKYVNEGFNNDTENSLIPSIVELSSYEQSSITESS
jgi:hypothetical protein